MQCLVPCYNQPCQQKQQRNNYNCCNDCINEIEEYDDYKKRKKRKKRMIINQLQNKCCQKRMILEKLCQNIENRLLVK